MKKRYLLTVLTYCTPLLLFAQTPADSLPATITLKQSINFALRNQPALKQAAIDRVINEKDIDISLSSWLPQITSSNQYQHYFRGGPVNAAQVNAGGTAFREFSTLGAQINQTIYNNEVLQASKASKYSRLYYSQNEVSSRIDVVSDVSKAFFDVLLSQRQLSIINENIIRLQRSLKDASSRYQAGVVDKIDYKQATIALNNELAQRKQTTETIKVKMATLKQIMGIQADKSFELSYDSTRYEQEAVADTNQTLNYTNRIEYQLLQTQKNLQNVNVNYYKYGFLPSLAAVGSYNLIFLNNNLAHLYSRSFTNAYAGLTLNIPIFQGGRRLKNLSRARLQVERTDLDIINQQNAISTEYVHALAAYKSNYNNWQTLKQNVALATDVYSVVSLQYREGVKTYLDVIVAQSDLRTAQLNYYNALFQVLASKIDLQKALGTLPIE
ncbi:TolC family protein [Mucilaginibacter auburnensis]|uniref:Outer membrane protein TolC n=1 Tax=Mucilaginibacter auburnensis TaxID=1457233 RepID=A0A2H9VV86_9SPHI|nr:TolC family protein [Mucilaginibacter auburnensis]PJJ84743.1 outer membrane protein TolC [Mucilaginibacter auburnensis]